MHEANEKAGNGPFDSRVPPFDRDIQVKPILMAGVAIIVTAVVCLLVGWWVLLDFKANEVAKDPAPSPIPEANQPYRPPAPNLQEFPPTADITEFHIWENNLLNNYAMVDEAAGVARIPIARAMELVLERGLPHRAVPTSEIAEPISSDAQVTSDTVAAPTEVHVEPPATHGNGH